MNADDAYLVAVADGLIFRLGAEWQRLSAHDNRIQRDRVRESLAALDVDVSFGDGELPVLPAAATAAVAVLRDQLQWIRDAAPKALASGADMISRILCTDPWPRIYTTAVLDTPATSPVHVVQASDLAARLDQWARMRELTKLGELRVLIMFGSPLGRSAWPFELDAFRELRGLDVSGSGLRTLPSTIGAGTSLEALELANNPLDPASLEVLGMLPSLRYLGLRGTGITQTELDRLRDRLPANCECAA